MKQNYQIVLDKTLEEIEKSGETPRLLLHSCCAPCSSYVLDYLSKYFYITVFYYNPNISPVEEFERRAAEQRRLIGEMPMKNRVEFVKGSYDSDKFYELAKGLEDAAEGGERCFKCYRLRLEAAAEEAKNGGFDYFTTTLSISPLKNAQVLNEIGRELSDKYDVGYLFSDFKKKNGYKRSCELSGIYSLYRQNYCGCVFSENEALRRKESKENE